MRKLLIFEGCFKPVRCPYVNDVHVRPYVMHVCKHPKLVKFYEDSQVSEYGFPEWCPLAKIIEETKK